MEIKLEKGTNLPADIGSSSYSCQISSINVITNGTSDLDDAHLKDHISITNNVNRKHLKVCEVTRDISYSINITES